MRNDKNRIIINMIKENLDFFNLSQKQASLLAGITEKTLSQILNGEQLLTMDSSEKIGKLFGIHASDLYLLQESLNKRVEISEQEKAVIDYVQTLKKFEKMATPSVQNKIFSIFPGKIENYKKYLASSLVGFKKYLDKPLAYLWIALMESRYSTLKSEGLFKKSSKQTIYKMVMNHLLSDKDFYLKLEEVKKYLSKNGIVLMEGPFIKDSTIHGVSLNRGGQRFIFISDLDKKEYAIIFSILHELVHFYENIDSDEQIDKFAINLLSEYISNNRIVNKDIELLISTDPNLENYHDYMYEKTKNSKRINFGEVDALFN